MGDAATMTYIIRTASHEFYCGKSNDIDKRVLQHKEEKIPHWFALKEGRKEIIDIIRIRGDHEKFIKRAGVSKIYFMLGSCCTR